MTKKIKKSLQIAWFLVTIFVIGGISGVIFERWIMPRLSSMEALNKFSFFKVANENVTIIERTEEKIIKENFSLSEAAQKVTPAVIKVVQYLDSQNSLGPLEKLKQGEVKTGLILTSDGLVVTVSNSLETSQEETSGPIKGDSKKTMVFVGAANSEPREAQLVGEDDYWGLEFYRLEESNLPVTPLGDDNSLERGERLILLGRQTASNAPIFSSGLFQELNKNLCFYPAGELFAPGKACLAERYQEALSIASLEGSHSPGTPVVDFGGSVVGMMTYWEREGQSSHVAIPIKRIEEAMNRVTQEEEAQSAFLGIRYQPINRELALVNQLPLQQGARVVGFYQSPLKQGEGQNFNQRRISPALRAGLRVGDIITEVDSQKVTLDNPLSWIIRQKESGQEIPVKFFRGEEELEINVSLD